MVYELGKFFILAHIYIRIKIVESTLSEEQKDEPKGRNPY